MEVKSMDEAREIFVAWLKEQGLEIPERILVDYIPGSRHRSGMLGQCVTDAYYEIRTFSPTGFWEVSLDGHVTRQS